MSDDTRSLVEQFFESLEGYKMPGFEHAGVYRCDYCSGVIHPTKRGRDAPHERVTHYLTSELLNEEYVQQRPAPFAVLRTYCPDCNRRKVRWPCQGWHELIVSSYFRPDGTIDTFEVEDFSSKDDGEPWDPKEVWEAVHGIMAPGLTFDKYMKFQMMEDSLDRETNNPERHAMGFGPEDIIDGLMAWEIDPREITDENGNIVMDEDKREELKSHMEKRAEELSSTVGDEGSWNEMVTRGR